MLQFHHVNLKYPTTDILALTDLSFHIKKGEFVYFTGRSGAGKSSVLNLIIKRIKPNEGQIYVNEENLAKYRGYRIAWHRRRIGVVFQDHQLLDHLSVLDNILFPLRITGVPRKEWNERADDVLKLVGLSHKAKAYPLTLSLGERQRVAIARAVVGRPLLLLADEPTGNLDPEIGNEIISLFEEINVKGATIILATHAREIVEMHKKRTLTLRQGQLVRDESAGGYFL